MCVWGGYWCEGMVVVTGDVQHGGGGGVGYWCEGIVVVCYRGCSAWGRWGGGVTGVKGWSLFATGVVQHGGGVCVSGGGGGGYWCEGMVVVTGDVQHGGGGGVGYWCERMVVVCSRGCSAWGRCVCVGGGGGGGYWCEGMVVVTGDVQHGGGGGWGTGVSGWSLFAAGDVQHRVHPGGCS